MRVAVHILEWDRVPRALMQAEDARAARTRKQASGHLSFCGFYATASQELQGFFGMMPKDPKDDGKVHWQAPCDGKAYVGLLRAPCCHLLTTAFSLKRLLRRHGAQVAVLSLKCIGSDVPKPDGQDMHC